MESRSLPPNRAIISDILLWILLALLLGAGVYFFAIGLPERRGQTITLTFKDANEISKGSTVRLMGTEIGYVDDLRMRHDHVEVKIRTYPSAMTIPSGSTFTILFTGLAGSKSIEVALPEQPHPTVNGQSTYLTEAPIRMKDVMNSTIDVTRALQGGAENIADFFGKKKPVEELQFNIRQSHQWSLATLDYVATFNRDMAGLNLELSENAKAAISSVDQLAVRSNYAVSNTSPQLLRPRIDGIFGGIRAFSNLLGTQAGTTTQTAKFSAKLSNLNTANSQLSAWMQKSATAVTAFPLAQYLDRFDAGETGFDNFVNRLYGWSSTDHGPAMQRTRSRIQQFNRQIINFDRKLSGQTPAKIEPQTAAAPGQQAKAKSKQGDERDKTHTASSNNPPLAREHSVVIVDRAGQPMAQLSKNQQPWWNRHPAATQATVTATPAKAARPSLPARLFGGIGHFFETVWDAVRSLF